MYAGTRNRGEDIRGNELIIYFTAVVIKVPLSLASFVSRHTPVVTSASIVPYNPWLSLPAGGTQHSCAPHAAERLTLLLELSAFGSAFTLPAAFTFTLAASTSTLAACFASAFTLAASTFFSAASTAFALAASM